MVTVLIEGWRADALAWIHRAEARALAAELRAGGETVRVARWDEPVAHAAGTLLVRVSDAVMLPAVRALADAGHLAQAFVRGTELTVAILGADAGMPLRIELREGTPYTFWRKYLWPPRKAPLADPRLAERARMEALRIARVFGIDWAARVDFIHETASGRLVFLECDAAPLVGPDSAFAASLTAAGMVRKTQLDRLLTPPRLVRAAANASG